MRYLSWNGLDPEFVKERTCLIIFKSVICSSTLHIIVCPAIMSTRLPVCPSVRPLQWLHSICSLRGRVLRGWYIIAGGMTGKRLQNCDDKAISIIIIIVIITCNSASTTTAQHMTMNYSEWILEVTSSYRLCQSSGPDAVKRKAQVITILQTDRHGQPTNERWWVSFRWWCSSWNENGT